MEILCFLNKDKIDKQLEKLKENIENDKERDLINYYESTWIKNNKKNFNYSNIITNLIKFKNNYKIKNGNKQSEKLLLDKLKGLNLLFFTNNICETILNKIANHLPNSRMTKNNFKDTIKYILNTYSFKKNKFVRKDYITRTLIIIEKFNINNEPKFINYDLFKKELELTIGFMTGKENISIIDEIIGTIYELEKDEDSGNNKIIDSYNKEEKLNIEFDSENNINSEEEDLSSVNIIDNNEDLLNIEQK